MSVQSTLSAMSQELLASNEASAPAHTIPADIAVLLDKTLADEAGSETDAPPQPEPQLEPVEVLTQLSSATSLKQIYPTVLVHIAVDKPLGQCILSTVLRHACITGYETSFKHKQKTKYLNSLHKTAFKEDGMFNQ